MVSTQEPVVYPNDSEGGTGKVTGWVGWVFFAGIIIFSAGFVNLLEGFIALVRHGYYLVHSSGLAVDAGYTTWGWTLIVFGVLLLFVGYGILSGQTWARIAGIVIAVVNAVVNMVFAPAYPLWAVIVITLDVLVIYALAVHGREARQLGY